LPSGEEIQASLRRFVDRWHDYSGTERSEAQTFLNELFACYGSDRRQVGAEFEDFRASAGFMDLHWPTVCIWEMKAPNRDLRVGQLQVERYWKESSDLDASIPAARFVVLCSFLRFEVWEPGRYPTRPLAAFDLGDLPERYDALAFLAGPHVEPNFTEHHRALTRDAAKQVASVFHALADRGAAPPDELQRFVLQSVWCMFAEDLGLLDGYPFQTILSDLRSHPDRSAADLGFLFRVLNQKTNHNRKGRLAGTHYVNGELFADPAEVELDRAEIDGMLAATEFDWRKVNPTIFGSLLEGVLGRDRRWELGAHYTHEVDIMKIVTPTIIRPWRERIDATATPAEARALLDELCRFRVLDPACGCGNFLYVSYRELRALEHELKQRIGSLAAETGLPRPVGPLPYYPLANVQGIDIERSAVLIARVTLWMGHRQVADLYGEAEAVLPLQDLSAVRHGDALRVAWPETDCIVGNPPFVGANGVRSALGDGFAEWVKREFGVGIKDLCTYWFRRAADHLEPGQRAGLVGTNSISQNLGRSASLDYVVANGGVITDAVSSQKWPGDAKVHVSIVNWIDQPTEPPDQFTLDGVSVPAISTSLRGEIVGWKPQPLAANRGRCFEGPSPKAKGFLVSADEAARLRALDDSYQEVVRPYLTASDITDDPEQRASRWTIDFGLMTLEQAMRFPDALRIVREKVRPERETNNRRSYREKWWIFAEPRTAMRAALEDAQRYAAIPGHAKRFTLVWIPADTLASNAVDVVAVDDDWSMGVLLSRGHEAWAWSRSSTLETRLRYTPTSVFEAFPWPTGANDQQREGVAEASRRLLSRRTEICVSEQIGLTELYNAVDEGAWSDVKALHKALDEAVVDCYGWPRSVAQDDAELVRRLTDLNREIVEGKRPYAPFK
jgi:hypothetical protein